MALTKNITTQHGIEITSAYIRVFGVDVTSKKSALAKIGIHANEQGQMVEFRTFSFDFNIEGQNVFSQAYTQLKTLPGYADAADC